MLIDELKARMFAAMKAKATIEKEVIRTAIGEITSTGEEPTDERVLKVLKKLIKSNLETAAAATNPEQQRTLEQELAILHEFVPKALSVEEVIAALDDVGDAIREAGNVGQATGLAMKHLKGLSVEVNGKDVSKAVQHIRGD